MRASLLLVILLNFLSYGSVEKFQSRFTFSKSDSGQLTEVRVLPNLKSRTGSVISVRGFWKGIKSEIKQFQGNMGIYSDLKVDLSLIDKAIAPAHIQLLSGNKKGLEESRNLQKSLRYLKGVNLKEIYSTIEKSNFIKKLQSKVREAFTYIDPTIIARPHHSSFFFKRNMGHKIVKWALSFIRNRFSSVPVVNTALYAVSRMMGFVSDQRAFNQNLFLYYVNNYSPEQLGLTKLEVDTIVSSIFESRISLVAFNESKLAQANWETYGYDKFYKLVRAGAVRRRKVQSYYTKMGNRLGYAFSHAQDGEEQLLINLFDKKHMFSKMPAVAMNLSKPLRVLRTRTIIYLAQLGLSLIPMPGILKSAANSVADSFYVDQGKTEGALLGYFEDHQKHRLAKLVIAQSVNPFLLIK